MTFMQLLKVLFKHGLGELPVFYSRVNGIYLGNMVYEKGHILFKDRGILSDINQAHNTIFCDKNILGMVCYREMLEWKSITYYGVSYCENTVIESDLHDLLASIKNKQGDRLLDFVGSFYRAYQLLLDHDFLPVILLQQVFTVDGKPGLAIGDLHSISALQHVHQEVRQILREAIGNRLTLKPDETLTSPYQKNQNQPPALSSSSA